MIDLRQAGHLVVRRNLQTLHCLAKQLEIEIVDDWPKLTEKPHKSS